MLQLSDKTNLEISFSKWIFHTFNKTCSVFKKPNISLRGKGFLCRNLIGFYFAPKQSAVDQTPATSHHPGLF